MLDLDRYLPLAIESFRDRSKSKKAGRVDHPIGRDGPYEIKESNQFLDNEDIRIQIHDPVWVDVRPQYGHYHDFFEMVYVYAGHFVQVIDGKEILQDKNKVIFINRGAEHNAWIESTQDIVFNIMLRTTVVEKTFLQLLSKNDLFLNFFLDAVYGIERQNHYLIFENTSALSDTIDDILREYYDHRDFCEQVIIAKLLQLFAELSRIHKNELPVSSEKGKQVSSILNYIKRNYATASLESVAREFSYSTRQISRLLNSATQRSFSDLINHYKIQSACAYIENSNLPLERIAEIVGYSDLHYFYKVFRRERGIPFSEYKKQISPRKRTN